MGEVSVKVVRVVDMVAVDGSLPLRLVELEDGSGRVEVWGSPAVGWLPSKGLGAESFFSSPPPSVELLRELEIPESDWPDWLLKRRSAEEVYGRMVREAKTTPPPDRHLPARP